ncbi:MAG: hypothetical protein WB791_03995 [Waddliaceae bacterium]
MQEPRSNFNLFKYSIFISFAWLLPCFLEGLTLQDAEKFGELPPSFLLKTPSYQRSPKVPKEIWESLVPYFLPEDHPIKGHLDEIFSQARVILSIPSMEKAEFLHPKPRKWTHLIVTKHPDIPGYIFKVYLDAQRYHKKKPEYVHWLERIQGASKIQNEIDRRHWQHLFKVPKKWIYPLPLHPSPPKEFIRKDFILVEEDMNIYDEGENYQKWKSSWITVEKLEALYTLLEKLGLHDCPKPDNIPFSKDGKIAFVDTQTLNKWPVLYHKLTPYLSPSLKFYWKNLLRSAPRKKKANLSS